eukprot:g2273.t1
MKSLPPRSLQPRALPGRSLPTESGSSVGLPTFSGALPSLHLPKLNEGKDQDMVEEKEKRVPKFKIGDAVEVVIKTGNLKGEWIPDAQVTLVNEVENSEEEISYGIKTGAMLYYENGRYKRFGNRELPKVLESDLRVKGGEEEKERDEEKKENDEAKGVKEGKSETKMMFKAVPAPDRSALIAAGLLSDDELDENELLELKKQRKREKEEKEAKKTTPPPPSKEVPKVTKHVQLSKHAAKGKKPGKEGPKMSFYERHQAEEFAKAKAREKKKLEEKLEKQKAEENREKTKGEEREDKTKDESNENETAKDDTIQSLKQIVEKPKEEKTETDVSKDTETDFSKKETIEEEEKKDISPPPPAQISQEEEAEEIIIIEQEEKAEWEVFAYIADRVAEAATAASRAALYAANKARLAELQYAAVVAGHAIPLELPKPGEDKPDEEKDEESDDEETKAAKLLQDEEARKKAELKKAIINAARAAKWAVKAAKLAVWKARPPRFCKVTKVVNPYVYDISPPRYVIRLTGYKMNSVSGGTFTICVKDTMYQIHRDKCVGKQQEYFLKKRFKDIRKLYDRMIHIEGPRGAALLPAFPPNPFDKTYHKRPNDARMKIAMKHVGIVLKSMFENPKFRKKHEFKEFLKPGPIWSRKKI